MAESAKQAWSEVGERFSAWGRQVTERYRSAGEAGSSEESKRELERAAKELIDELSRGFTAVADTLRDERARKDLGEAVGAIGDAITATVDEATSGLRSGSAAGKGTPPPGGNTQNDPPSAGGPPEDGAG
jgi:hypothetical protein